MREVLAPRNLRVGDFAVLKGTGAYCSAMSLKNYNSFPEAAEVLLREDGVTVDVIRKRQEFADIMSNEVDVIGGY